MGDNSSWMETILTTNLILKSEKNRTMCHTAIVLFGQLRTFQNISIVESYKKFLGSFPSIDLYIICWNTRGFSANHGNVNTFEKSKCEETFTNEEVNKHYQQFSFFNLVVMRLLDFDEIVASWSQEYRDIYYTPFDYNQVTTSVPVQFMIQYGSLLIQSPEKYRHIYFMRPDAMIIHPLDFNSDTVLKDKTVYFNTVCDRCIDHGFFMNGDTVTVLNDLFDKYIENVKNCRGSDPFFNQEQSVRDNNHLLSFHLKSKGVTLCHKSVQIFHIVR